MSDNAALVIIVALLVLFFLGRTWVLAKYLNKDSRKEV